MTDMDIWANQAEHELPANFFESLPTPVYWRVLVMPLAAREKSKGGIIIAPQAQEAQQHLCYVGKILAAGGEAFESERFANEKNLPQIGDWIIYGRYAGQRLLWKNKIRLLLINDDEVLAVVKDPDDVKVHY
jgi:co-chaperonin GroES (HSP10)